MTVSPSGQIYASDEHNIYKYDSSGNASLVLQDLVGFVGLMTFDPNGNLVYSDGASVFQVSASGNTRALAGSGPSFIGNGPIVDGQNALTVQLVIVDGVAFSAQGDLFIADYGSHRVRKVDASTGIITTVAGNGWDSYPGSLSPGAIVTASNGDLLIASAVQIYRLDSSGSLTVFAGNGSNAGASGNGGPAPAATLCVVNSIASDDAGDVFLSGCGLRRIDGATGIIQQVYIGALSDPIQNLVVRGDDLYFTAGAPLHPLQVYKLSGVHQVPPTAQPSIRGAYNAATFDAVLNPGMIVSLIGSNLGPAAPATLQLGPDGKVTTSLGAVQVYFNDVAAPLLYVSAGQINAVAPFSLQGNNPTIRVECPAGTAAMSAYQPLLQPNFSVFPGAVVNADGSLNGPTHPAQPGSTVVMYGTGLGQPSPPLNDGEVVPGPGQFPGANNARAYLNDLQHTGNILYLGPAPSLVAGVDQFNLGLPSNAPAGQVTVTLSAGQLAGRATIYVQGSGPTPVVTGVTGDPTLPITTLTISGTGFSPNIVTPTTVTATVYLYFGGALLTSIGTSTISATLQIQFSFHGNSGAYAVEVVNSAGLRSNRFPFTVPAAPPTPIIPQVSGVSVGLLGTPFALPADQTFTVDGMNFLPNATADLFYSGAFVTTISLNTLRLTGMAVTSINFNGLPGLYGIEVVNPDGNRSARFPFAVTDVPVPAARLIIPTVILATNGSQQIGVDCPGNIPGVTVDIFYLGNYVTTVPVPNPYYPGIGFVYDFGGKPGDYGIEVVNPGNHRSARLNFTVQPPTTQPVVTYVRTQNVSLEPEPLLANAIVNLAVSGFNLVAPGTIELFRNGTSVQSMRVPFNGQFSLFSLVFPSAGAYQFQWTNPDGIKSNLLPFQVAAVNPTITGFSPATIRFSLANPGTQSVTVIGSGFQPGLTVDILINNSLRIGSVDSSQIQNVAAGSFTMNLDLNAFRAAVEIQVLNPDSGRSGFAIMRLQKTP